MSSDCWGQGPRHRCVAALLYRACLPQSCVLRLPHELSLQKGECGQRACSPRGARFSPTTQEPSSPAPPVYAVLGRAASGQLPSRGCAGRMLRPGSPYRACRCPHGAGAPPRFPTFPPHRGRCCCGFGVPGSRPRGSRLQDRAPAWGVGPVAESQLGTGGAAAPPASPDSGPGSQCRAERLFRASSQHAGALCPSPGQGLPRRAPVLARELLGSGMQRQGSFAAEPFRGSQRGGAAG